MIALLLSVVMIFALLCAVPLRGLATDITPTSILVTEPLNFRSADYPFTAIDSSGPGWTWVQSTRTLTLDNFNMNTVFWPVDDTGFIGAITLPEASTIVLNGVNNIVANPEPLRFRPDGTGYGYAFVSSIYVQGNRGIEVKGNGTLNANTDIVSTIAGNIVIHSGTINVERLFAEGGIFGAGNIIINSGNINATLVANGDITINGGTVTAITTDDESAAVAASIRYNEMLDLIGGNITITGGVLNAKGGNMGFGLVTTFFNGRGNINISGGVVNASGGRYAISAWSLYEGGESGNINITGGTVTATASEPAEFHDFGSAFNIAPRLLPANYWWRISENFRPVNNADSPYIWSNVHRYVHITTVAPPPESVSNTEFWQPPLSTNRFNDVPNDNWRNTAVSWADRNDITTGSPAGSNTFRPDNPVTRAEFVTFLHRVYGSPSAPRATFRDMPGNAAFQNAISWAFAEGITTGSPAGSRTFMPNDNITREQIAAMLYRYVGGGTPAPQNVLDRYTDNNRISTWAGARDAVNWAVYYGLMGVGTTTLNPRGNATRAEAVTMLYRVVETFNIQAP